MNIYKGPKYSGPDTLTGGGVSTTPLAAEQLHPLELHNPASCIKHSSSRLMILLRAASYIPHDSLVVSCSVYHGGPRITINY